MTESLSLYSEPYGATGNIGDNFRRLLGAPTLDVLQTVIREAVQNIADAARLGSGPEVVIRLRELTEEQRRLMRDWVFSELPEEEQSGSLLAEMKSRERIVVMEICDFSTVGLGGPTRPDRIPVGTETTDFIDFLRNIGTARDTDQGGGTYGFGKVALYRASRCSTILVDTLPHGTGPDGRRLIGCHVGQSFSMPEEGMLRRFTGRHWWGIPDTADGVVDPLTGSAAGDLASALGLPDRDGGRSGTSIMVLDFDPDDRDLWAAGNRVIETLLWNFWPRMMSDVPDRRRFRCRVEVNGRDLEIPAPEHFPPLDLFAKAMKAARAGTGNDVRPVASGNPVKHLGLLALEKGQRTQRRPLVQGESSVVPQVSHHIALMRPVELVVKYLKGTGLPDEGLEWAGVFVVSNDDEVETAFADSEPPAHDDWVSDNLPTRRAKTFVNVALRDLKAAANEFGLPPAVQVPGPSSGPPLARVAGVMGSVLEGTEGDGAGPTTGGGGGGTRPRKARIGRPVFERLELSGKDRVAVFNAAVRQDTRSSGKAISVTSSLAIDGKGTRQVDDDVVQPTVLSVSSEDGELHTTTGVLEINGAEGRFEIRVRVPDETAVTVEATLLSEADA